MNLFIEEPKKLLDEIWNDSDVPLTLFRFISSKNSILLEKMDSVSLIYLYSLVAKMKTLSIYNQPFIARILDVEIHSLKTTKVIKHVMKEIFAGGEKEHQKF